MSTRKWLREYCRFFRTMAAAARVYSSVGSILAKTAQLLAQDRLILEYVHARMNDIEAARKRFEDELDTQDHLIDLDIDFALGEVEDASPVTAQDVTANDVW